MSHSLCVVLPVRNAQATLADCAAKMLEVLPDLTSRFELIIIDNGSTDATLDVARELADRFPQIRVLGLRSATDLAGIVRTALEQTHSWQILLCDESCRLELADLHKLWRSREEFDAVLAWPVRAGAVDEQSFGQRVRAWRRRLTRTAAAPASDAMPGFQLLHRRVLERLRWVARDRYELLAELSRQNFRWQVVEVRAAKPTALGRAGLRVDELPQSIMGPAARRTQKLDALRDFALGE